MANWPLAKCGPEKGMEGSILVASVPILDREIEYKQPTAMQVALLGREYNLIDRANKNKELISKEPLKHIQAIGRILEVIEGLVKEDEDKEFLVEGMRNGTVELDDLLPLLKAAIADQDKASGPVARRGRAKR